MATNIAQTDLFHGHIWPLTLLKQTYFVDIYGHWYCSNRYISWTYMATNIAQTDLFRGHIWPLTLLKQTYFMDKYGHWHCSNRLISWTNMATNIAQTDLFRGEIWPLTLLKQTYFVDKYGHWHCSNRFISWRNMVTNIAQTDLFRGEIWPLILLKQIYFVEKYGHWHCSNRFISWRNMATNIAQTDLFRGEIWPLTLLKQTYFVDRYGHWLCSDIYFVDDTQPQLFCSNRFILSFHPFGPSHSQSLPQLSIIPTWFSHERISQTISSQISTPAVRHWWLHRTAVQSPSHPVNNQSLHQSRPDSATQHLATQWHPFRLTASMYQSALHRCPPPPPPICKNYTTVACNIKEAEGKENRNVESARIWEQKGNKQKNKINKLSETGRVYFVAKDSFITFRKEQREKFWYKVVFI